MSSESGPDFRPVKDVLTTKTGVWGYLIAFVLALPLVVAIALPGMQQYRERSRRTQVKANLEKLGRALAQYEASVDGGRSPLVEPATPSQ